MNELLDLLLENAAQTSPLEIIAVFFGLLSVWYSRQLKIWVYPTGIISVLIYVYICLHARLYADMVINGIYFVMSIYGWYNWSRKDGSQNIYPVSWNTKRLNFIGILVVGLLFLLIRFILTNYTDSDVPEIDALTTAIFMVGMWFMAFRKIENWIYWIIGDVISIPLYIYKGLALTGFQFSVFLLMAFSGLLSWIKVYRDD